MRFLTIFVVFFAVAQLATALFGGRIPAGCILQQCMRRQQQQQTTCPQGYTHYKYKRCSLRKKQEICCPAAPQGQGLPDSQDYY